MSEKLSKIVKYLRSNKIELALGHENARIDAAKSQTAVVKKLVGKFGSDIITDSDHRWYNFAIRDGFDRIPVKIKISRFKGADNLSCKLGIYYALTGKWPVFNDEISWADFFKLLGENLDPGTAKDFYFLVINRNNPSDVFYIGLKQLPEIMESGNNPPFQCSWSKNREPVNRSGLDAQSYILKKLELTAIQRAEMSEAYKRWVG